MDDAPTADPGATLLGAEDISKAFPGVQALDHMHLDLRAGEVLGLVGENGAGKSTLMKLLSGIYEPDTGRLRFGGADLDVSGPSDALELGIAIIHQEFNLVPDLTVAQNIFLGREPTRWRMFTQKSRLNTRARDLLARLELPLKSDATVGDLSVAQQQMVEIAKALSYDARVLIMDEPTAALSETEVDNLHALIRRFRTDDTAVIYISHRLEEQKAITDRITVIRDGSYVDTVATDATTTDEIINLMVGRALDTDARPQNVRDDRPVRLQVRNLSTPDLIDDVSFDLREGEILGFAGLMGAGRTEVARALIGADPTISKEIHLDGERVEIRNPADAAQLRIGYLSEDRKRYGLLLDQGIVLNAGLNSLQEGFSNLGVVRRRQLLESTSVAVNRLQVKTPSLRQPAENLSGGNQQKLVVARWLIKDSDIFIFDEPTRGIDVGAKDEMYQLLNELAQLGKSIIMISSELPEVLRMSHRVAVMNHGRMTAVLDRDQISSETIMHYATTGHVQSQMAQVSE